MFARTTFMGTCRTNSAPRHRAHQAERRDLRMRKTTVSIAVLGAALLAVTACSSSKNNNATNSTPAGGGASTPAASTPAPGGSGGIDGKGAKVGIILPDTTSSPRWVTADPEALKANCT